jgi:hypothetical protein
LKKPLILFLLLLFVPLAASAVRYLCLGNGRGNWQTADRSSAVLLPLASSHPDALIRVFAAPEDPIMLLSHNSGPLSPNAFVNLRAGLFLRHGFAARFATLRPAFLSHQFGLALRALLDRAPS